ncbi:micronuclear linker histone polyprotein-like [Clytia hemisphaerica]|uniref:Uncharacterized protein n=1 Tax=Clytia hemisphaerica TaxID=252671 RepID=A0A7M5V4F1_9CNID|eukprot:TCONS_00006124-protein
MTFDIESITSQQKLNKRKSEKVLKELSFHNGRNLLTMFPLEFVEQNKSDREDTLVLVFQCSKKVSKDISGYLSTAADQRRRSTLSRALDLQEQIKEAEFSEKQPFNGEEEAPSTVVGGSPENEQPLETNGSCVDQLQSVISQDLKSNISNIEDNKTEGKSFDEDNQKEINSNPRKQKREEASQGSTTQSTYENFPSPTKDQEKSSSPVQKFEEKSSSLTPNQNQKSKEKSLSLNRDLEEKLFSSNEIEEETLLTPTQDSEKTSFSPAQDTEKMPSSPTQDSEKTPSSPAQDSEKTPSSPTEDSEKAPSSPAQDTEKIPSIPIEDTEKTPSSLTQDSEKTPSSPTQDSEKMPSSPTQDSEKMPSSFIQDSEEKLKSKNHKKNAFKLKLSSFEKSIDESTSPSQSRGEKSPSEDNKNKTFKLRQSSFEKQSSFEEASLKSPSKLSNKEMLASNQKRKAFKLKQSSFEKQASFDETRADSTKRNDSFKQKKSSFEKQASFDETRADSTKRNDNFKQKKSSFEKQRSTDELKSPNQTLQSPEKQMFYFGSIEKQGSLDGLGISSIPVDGNKDNTDSPLTPEESEKAEEINQSNIETNINGDEDIQESSVSENTENVTSLNRNSQMSSRPSKDSRESLESATSKPPAKSQKINGFKQWSFEKQNSFEGRKSKSPTTSPDWQTKRKGFKQWSFEKHTSIDLQKSPSPSPDWQTKKGAFKQWSFEKQISLDKEEPKKDTETIVVNEHNLNTDANIEKFETQSTETVKSVKPENLLNDKLDGTKEASIKTEGETQKEETEYSSRSEQKVGDIKNDVAVDLVEQKNTQNLKEDIVPKRKREKSVSFDDEESKPDSDLHRQDSGFTTPDDEEFVSSKNGIPKTGSTNEEIYVQDESQSKYGKDYNITEAETYGSRYSNSAKSSSIRYGAGMADMTTSDVSLKPLVLTETERAYINEARSFHGRQCRRRRIRRTREEEGEYLGSDDVITRIREKTQALLERQNKMMRSYQLY